MIIFISLHQRLTVIILPKQVNVCQHADDCRCHATLLQALRSNLKSLSTNYTAHSEQTILSFLRACSKPIQLMCISTLSRFNLYAQCVQQPLVGMLMLHVCSQEPMPPHGVGLYSQQDLQIYAGNHRVMPCTIGLSRLNNENPACVCLSPASLEV